VYLVMASQFESLLHPFVILFTIPLAVIGSIIGLRLFGMPLSVIAGIGIIMLAGIVVNNAIVLIDRVNQSREAGMSKIDALVEAARSRLRPIMMTTITTLVGFLPLATGLGDGAEIRQPMAITVIFGLSISTALTLIVIPVLYAVLDRSETRGLRSFGKLHRDSVVSVP
jgi:hydrophobic/amphiphilic exporter-1 (mainly G- bacteria), HAE1 family